MKTIIRVASILPIAILIASISSTIGSQQQVLRANNGRVAYDTSKTCQSGMIAALVVLQPSTSSSSSSQGTPASIVFRVSHSSGSHSDAPYYYTKTVHLQSNGRAKMSLPLTEAFGSSTQHKTSSSLVCSIQYGASIVKVNCPTLPVCATPTMPPTLAPTDAPTEAPTPAPTVPPTLTADPLYDVRLSTPFDYSYGWCMGGTLNVTVLHKDGQPVQGAALDLTVVGAAQYHVQGMTDANGKATLSVTLDAGDRQWKNWHNTLTVTNSAAAPSGSQTFAPFINFNCWHGFM